MPGGFDQILAELLRPMSPAFTELWLDGEKAATVEWRRDVDSMPGLDVDAEMVKDNGRGIVLDNPVEPLYGDIYMPRESKQLRKRWRANVVADRLVIHFSNLPTSDPFLYV